MNFWLGTLELGRQQARAAWRERVTVRQAGDQLMLPLVHNIRRIKAWPYQR